MMDEDTRMAPGTRLITVDQIQQLIPLSVSTIYRMMRAGTFPRSVRLGPNRVAWRYEEVMLWIAERDETAPDFLR